MIDSSIAFLDSGIGGLPYLDWIRNRRPDIPLSYLADTANFPYGELEPDEVRGAVLQSVDRLLQSGTPRLLVVACNTASVSALEDIRAVTPCPVVGTVPAVKPAAGLSSQRPIGVLATSGTVDSPYLNQLIEAFANGLEVLRVAAGDIVRFVEERWLDEGDVGVLPILESALETLQAAGVGSVVIGCTHFLHVLNPIAEIMGPDVQLVDSRDGVGRRILSLLNEDLQISDKHRDPAGGDFLVTQADMSETRYREFARRHGLDWIGELN